MTPITECLVRHAVYELRDKMPSNQLLVAMLVITSGSLGERLLDNAPTEEVRALAIGAAAIAVRIIEEGDSIMGVTS